MGEVLSPDGKPPGDAESFRFKEKPLILDQNGYPMSEPLSNAFFRWWLRLVVPQKKKLIVDLEADETD